MRTTSRLLVCFLVLLMAACANLKPRPELPPETALPPGSDAPLDDLIALAETRHPGQSAFRLLSEGMEAFALRERSAALAARSLDVQTYIWHDDQTGGFLAYRLLEAAERGVRVRLLVDDMNGRGSNLSFAALDAHPNIQVRMFNPFRSRSGTLGFALEALHSFDRINRRMHNKSWIADNRIAIVGGRNLGDEYFSASDQVNFVDLDFAMVGPIVRDTSAVFDGYWNSPAAYPIELLAPRDVSAQALEALRKKGAPSIAKASSSPYAAALRDDQAVQRLIEGDWPMYWASRYRLVADDPLKVLGKSEGLAGSNVLALLHPMIESSRSNAYIISPYFVPGANGADMLASLARSGRAVNVLTNSLAANDVAAVYGGYAQRRKPMLEGGVKLWELKPVAGMQAKSSLFGSSGASLHTKALTVDDSLVFVGSYNLDPRSTSLNTEQGVFVENSVIAAQLNELFKAETAGAKAWAVTLEEQRLRWSDGEKVYDRSPEASLGKKFQAWVVRVLGLESQL
ncbi:MAG: phospholipase D family protein [Burkholderiales bacterium]|nr:phospholipase D family protein [Burkholderiales bacterium]